MSELDDDVADFIKNRDYVGEILERELDLNVISKGKNIMAAINEEVSLDREIEKLDFSVNEKIKYCPLGKLDNDDNSLSLLLDIKDIFVLMATEIKSLNSKVLMLENNLNNVVNGNV